MIRVEGGRAPNLSVGMSNKACGPRDSDALKESSRLQMVGAFRLGEGGVFWLSL